MTWNLPWVSRRDLTHAELAATGAIRAAASAERQAEAAIAYAAERDALAKRAGELLEERQRCVEELAAEVVAYKRAIGVLAEKLGEAHAYLHHVEGDTVAEAVVAPIALRFGRVGGAYQHKLDGHRITLTERTSASDWAYRSPAGLVWHIFDEDLHDQYDAVSATDDATVPMRIGGGS